MSEIKKHQAYLDWLSGSLTLSSAGGKNETIFLIEKSDFDEAKSNMSYTINKLLKANEVLVKQRNDAKAEADSLRLLAESDKVKLAKCQQQIIEMFRYPINQNSVRRWWIDNEIGDDRSVLEGK